MAKSSESIKIEEEEEDQVKVNKKSITEDDEEL